MLTKKKRRVLFYGAIALFLLLTLPVVFYSLGYGIGSDFKIHKTGGVFLKVSEAGAKAVIGKKNKNISLITKSALIKNLLPGSYQALVEKDGFWAWTKVLMVFPGTVTGKGVLLVPKNASIKILGTSTPQILTDAAVLKKNIVYKSGKPLFYGVKKFWPLTSDSDILIWGEDGKFYINRDLFDVSEKWGNDVFNILRGKQSSVFDENQSRIIYWDENGVYAYWVDDLKKMPEWEKNLKDQNQPERGLRVLSASPINGVLPYPAWPDQLMIASGNSIYVVEMDFAGGQNIFPIYKGKAPKIAFVDQSSNSLMLLDNGAYLEIKLP